MRTAATCPQSRLTFDSRPSTGSHARHRLAVRLGAFARRTWRAYWDWRARQVTMHILHSLDDRTLRDLGISPSEIESCVHARGSDRRRKYDVAWMWRLPRA